MHGSYLLALLPEEISQKERRLSRKEKFENETVETLILCQVHTCKANQLATWSFYWPIFISLPLLLSLLIKIFCRFWIGKLLAISRWTNHTSSSCLWKVTVIMWKCVHRTKLTLAQLRNLQREFENRSKTIEIIQRWHLIIKLKYIY